VAIETQAVVSIPEEATVEEESTDGSASPSLARVAMDDYYVFRIGL